MRSAVDTDTYTRAGLHIMPLIATMLFSLAGCVAQSTYDNQVAETADLQQTLAQAQLEASELAKQVAALQASNRELDAMADDLRTAIQREEDAVSARRQKAQDTLAALQTQVAALINQSRTLGRDMADAKQQNTSLRASAAQFKRELEEFREQPPTPAAAPSAFPVPERTLAPDPNQAAPAAQPFPPQQTAQTNPATPASPAAGVPSQTDPASADDSWSGWLLSWLSSLWSWLFQ